MIRRPEEKVRQVVSALTSKGIQTQVLPTCGPNDASRLARQAVDGGYDLIAACGGDGTINEVITGMVPSRVPLLAIPSGTANVLAREIGLPFHPPQCVDLLSQGLLSRISLGKVDHRYFVLMAGIGVDAGIIRVLNYRLKRWLGVGAYWLAGLTQFFRYSFPRFALAANGNVEEATFAVVSKVRHYGGPFHITRQADLFSNQFDVCLFQSNNRWRYAYYLLQVCLGLHPRLPDVRCFRTGAAEVWGDSSIGVQVDGELIGSLPQQFSIEQDALSIIVPPQTANISH